MIKVHRFLIASILSGLFITGANAIAPVVDDSENFAMLDEQGDYQSPVAHDTTQDAGYSDDGIALAKDTPARTASNNADLINKMHGLQQDIQELRGQLEIQARDIKTLQEQQLAFYKDLDARIQSSPLKTAKKPATTNLAIDEQPSPTPEPKVTPASPIQKSPQASATSMQPIVTAAERTNPADEQISYLAAYELVKNKQFDDALNAMQTFVNKYPQGGYTANAQYWLGELFMVKKEYPQAIEHFNVVLQQFPSSSKNSASLLKLGYALAASGKTAEAKLRLQEVMKKYPDTQTAQLASAKLAHLSG